MEELRLPRQISVNELGIRILVDTEHPVVDIIAVHGLGATPSTTWTKKIQKLDTNVTQTQPGNDEQAQRVNWLNHNTMLPAEIKNARIMVFNYDSNWYGDNAVKIRLDHVADDFRRQVERQRRDCVTRPLVLIGHCFGGLVIEKALIKLQASKILDATTGIVLLGTPHRGTDNITAGDLVNRIIRAGAVAHTSSLTPLQANNEMVLDTVHGFATVAREQQISIHCFFEQKGSEVSKMFGDKEKDFIVDERSAKLDGCELYGLPLDHYQLNKYSDPEDGNWRQLHGVISDLCKDAPLLMKKRMTEIKSDDFSITFSLSGVPDIHRFVGREKELAEMHKELQGDGSRRTVSLYGLGGIGKTQLSIEYAKQHKDNYSAIFWFNIKDEDSLKQTFIKVARQILRDHPAASLPSSIDTKANLDEVVDAVKAWLSLPNNTRWLLIYDNYDNPKVAGNKDPSAVDIRRFFPESYQGAIIITTRFSQVEHGHCMKVSKLLDMHDSLKILSNVSGRESLINDLDAIRLVKELDGLPLALATAGAYLNQVTMRISEYLRLYKASWAKLQQVTPERDSYEDRTLYSTWQISFDRLEQRNHLSAELLRFWAYFDNQDIWLELLQHNSSDDPKWIQDLTEDELNFHGAIRVLSDYGLVEEHVSPQQSMESRGYSIHGCVHSWTIHVLNQEWKDDWARLAVKCIGSHMPDEQDLRPWVLQRRLLQHAARCSHMILNSMIEDTGMDWAYHNIGLLHRSQGKLDEAEQMYQRALAGKEKALGPDHISTFDTVHNLGLLYSDQDKLDEAERMYQRALAGYEKALGPEHTSTLDTVHNLGRLYSDQGKLKEAKQMYQRALAGKEKALGPDHTSTLDTVNNLGNLYSDQDKLDVAERMYQRALAGYEKTLGPDHTSTLDTVNNLGLLYSDQDKLDEAEQMYQRALAGYEKTLGPDHISTLNTVNNLGLLYSDQGKLNEAEQMYQRALAGKEKALGPDHTSTLDTVNNLGLLHSDQDKLDEAERMYQRALAGYEKTLGPDHTSTLDTVNNLGLLYSDQSKLKEAKQMYQRALAGYEKALGPDHTSTLDTVNNLGNLYFDQNKLDEAERMYQRALAGYEKALGPEHTSTLDTVHNLGNLYKSQGKLDVAERMYQQALAGYE